MKKKLFRKVLALVLVLTLLPCWSSLAWADSPVVADSGDVTTGSVNVEDSTSVTAVTAENGYTATVNGDVSASSSGGPDNTAAIGASADGGTVAVSGDVSASSANNDSPSIAIGAQASDGGSAAIEGNVSATGSGTSGGSAASGVIVSEDTGSTSTVTVGGDVSAATNSNDDVANYADGVEALADGIGSAAVVEVAGDVSATTTGTGEATGILADTYLYTSADVSAGSVEATAEGTGTATGIDVYAGCESTATINITGEVEAEAEQSASHNDMNPDALGLDITAYDGGHASVTAGSVEAEAEKGVAHGIDAEAQECGTVDINLTTPDEEGNVLTVTGVEYAAGAVLTASGSGSSVNLNAEGGMSVESEKNGVGMTMNIDKGGQATIRVDGDVEVDGKQTSGIYVDNDEGLVDVDILGDVEATSTGISVDNTGSAITSILVDGSVKADAGFIVGSQTTPDNLEITVWQVSKTKVDGEEHVVLSGDTSERVSDNSKKVEQNINYIIRIMPDQQSIISLTGTTDKDGYDTAHMGDKVAMKVSVPAGYELTGAFGDDGFNLPLKMDSSGNYYIIVPMGGGVYLSAVLSPLWSEGGNGSASGEYIDYYSYAGKLSYITITFELNEGHTLSGNPGPIIKSVPAGTWVRLIEAPYKTGSTFELWHTDDPSIKVSQPNESFCAMGDVTFTAKWLGEELPYKMTADESNLVSTLSATSVIPVIEEPAEEAPTVEEAESTTEETESITEEAPAAEEAPVSKEPASAEETTAADAQPDEAVAEEAPVAAEPASESSMMIEAMTTLTAATEALQAATEALIANTAPAADEAEAATEAPAAEEADTSEESEAAETASEEAGVEEAADEEISAEAVEEEQPAVEETSSSMDAAREELQRITEELDAAKSELKATSAELDTAKGELKATTEELNAAKDELRATTDELVEAKDALRSAADELNAAREEFRLLLEELKAQVPVAETEESLESSPAADAAEEEASAQEDVPTEETDAVNVDDAAEEEPAAAESTDKS